MTKPPGPEVGQGLQTSGVYRTKLVGLCVCVCVYVCVCVCASEVGQGLQTSRVYRTKLGFVCVCVCARVCVVCVCEYQRVRARSHEPLCWAAHQSHQHEECLRPRRGPCLPQ